MQAALPVGLRGGGCLSGWPARLSRDGDLDRATLQHELRLALGMERRSPSRNWVWRNWVWRNIVMASIRFDLYHAVLDAMTAAGCAPRDPKVPGLRWALAPLRRGGETGEAARTAGSCCMTRSFLSVRSVPGKPGSPRDGAAVMSRRYPEQRERQRRQMAEIAAQRAAEERRRQAQARERAERLWARASPIVSDRHPYLRNKQVPALGLRQLRELLLVPVHDGDGTLRSLEFLNPEGARSF